MVHSADYVTDKALTVALRSFRVEPLQERIYAGDAQFLRSDRKITPLVKATLDEMSRDVRHLLEDEGTDERDFYQLSELGSENIEEEIYVLIYILYWKMALSASILVPRRVCLRGSHTTHR